MLNIRPEDQIVKFVCIAEAVAHYYKLGFETLENALGADRVMVGEDKIVEIHKTDFLDVTAIEIPR